MMLGEIEPDTQMADLFREGKVVNPGCPNGEIDPVGFD